MISTPDLVINLLNELTRGGVSFMVGGSFASSAWGQPRQTNDIDLEIETSSFEPQKLFEIFRNDYLGSYTQILESLADPSEFASFQFLHIEQTFKIDFFPVRESAYTRESFARAQLYQIGPGHRFPFKSPEDIIITKLRWFELGNRVSDRQWNDIVNILEIQATNLDEDYLARWCKFFEVADLLAAVQDQAIPPNS